MTVSWSPAAQVQLLTIPEAAKRLRCSESHIYRLIANRELRAVDVSQPGARRAKTRISEADLARYIEGAGDAA
jgi:excisionase family DNA binding protein